MIAGMSTSYNIAGTLSFEKNLVEVGCGKYHPSDFSVCKIVIRCEEKLADVIGYTVNQDTEVVVGRGGTYAACVIDVCLLTMKEGERCFICCDKSPSTDDLKLDVTLISFQCGVEIFSMSIIDKVSRALDLKELGAAAYKSGDTRAAFYKFSRSLKYISCAMSDKDEASRIQSTSLGAQLADTSVMLEVPRIEHDELLCQCLLNIAACQLRHQNYRLAKANCTRAVGIEPNSVKGLFRRARCSVELGQDSEAIVDLERAASIEPTNREVLKLLRSVKKEQRKSEELLAKAMGKMFQKT